MTIVRRGCSSCFPTEDLFVYVHRLHPDRMLVGAIAVPARPGPAAACRDADLLATALVRHLLGRRREAGFLAEVARGLEPPVPAPSAPERGQPQDPLAAGRVWQFRVTLAARQPEDDCQQVDTSALPVKHPSRVRGPDQWTGPGTSWGRRPAITAPHRATPWSKNRALTAGIMKEGLSRLRVPPLRSQPCSRSLRWSASAMNPSRETECGAVIT